MNGHTPITNGLTTKHLDQSPTGSGENRLLVRDVTYDVTTWSGSWWKCGCCRRATKRVLHDINLTVGSGQIVAFIGNSGSGKTSLLNVISGRHNGSTQGNVNLNDKPLSRTVFRDKAGYVIQADRLLPSLTVRETLTYTAKLRFCQRASATVIKQKVERCLRQMTLSHVADSLVGGTLTRGISGGEKRRLSIAVQLLQDPELLLLDEPTTGLDSFTAHYLVETLASLAHYDNKMVVMTIHQPRSDIFRLLDTVGIMSGGSMVYYGPRQDLVSYFSGLGYPCPTFSNPLDYCIDVASIDRRSDALEDKSAERVETLCAEYKRSSVYAAIRKELDEAVSIHLKDNSNSDDTSSCGYGVKRFFGLIGVNISRLFLAQWRDRPGFFNRIFMLMSFAFFNWIFCWRLDLSYNGIQERIGIFYQTTSFTCTLGVMVIIPIFPSLRNLYDRESLDGLYNCLHFLLAYYVHSIPFQLVSCLLFSVWLYWGIGLNPEPSSYFIYLFVCLVQSMIGEMVGLIFLGIFQNAGVAQAISTMLVGIAAMYSSGFLKSTTNLWKPLSYFVYISHFKYSSAVLATGELLGLEFDCSTTATNCTLPGDVFLETLLPGAEDNFSMNCGIMVAMVVVYWLLPILVFFVRGRKVLH